MNNVSFGSNYKFNIGHDFPYEVMDKIGRHEIQGNATVSQKYPSFQESCKTGVFAEVTVSVPDKLDADIESILASKGIKFSKLTTKEALDPENIKNRIQLSELDKRHNCFLVDINTKAMDKLFKENGLAYIEPNGTNGIGERYKRVGEFLRTGKNIDATRVVLGEKAGKLTASILDGRHRFAYMRDLGMKEIPLSMDEDSYNLAIKHGLIK